MKAGAITVIVIASVEAVALLLGVEMDTLLPAYSTYAAYVLAFGGLLVGWFVAALRPVLGKDVKRQRNPAELLCFQMISENLAHSSQHYGQN